MLKLWGSLLTAAWHSEWMIEYYSRIKSRCGILEYRPEIKITETRSIPCQMKGQSLSICIFIFAKPNIILYALESGPSTVGRQTIFCGLIWWLGEIWHRILWWVGTNVLGQHTSFIFRAEASTIKMGATVLPKRWDQPIRQQVIQHKRSHCKS